MKLLKFASMTVLLFIGMSVGQAASGNDDDRKQTTVQIPISPLYKGAVSHPHRAPAVIPIEAEYNGYLSAIVVSFRCVMDDVTAELMNITTGEYISQSLDGAGTDYIPVSGNSGLYTISFTLSSGTQYTGQFVL